MGGAVYLGDEARAAAWRLAGIETSSAAAFDELGAMFDAACGSADLVLLAATSAANLPPAVLDKARHATLPLLWVLPDTEALRSPSELAQRVRRQLGMDVL